MPLPVSMGGVGIGGRTKVVTAVALASRLDAVLRCRASSPALRAVGDALVARADRACSGAAGEQRSAVAVAALRRPPPAAPAVTAPDAAPPPGVRQLRRATAAELGLGEGASEEVSMRDSRALAARRAAAPPVVPGLPVLRAGPTMPPSDDSPLAGLCRELEELLDAHTAHVRSPASAGLWATAGRQPGRRAGAGQPPSFPAPLGLSGLRPTPQLASGPLGADRDTPHPTHLTWKDLLSLADARSQRDLSRPALAAAHARVYHTLSMHQRARMAACQGHMVALWLSALPTPGPHGTALTGDAMRVAVRLWLGAPPRSDPPAARCRCGADADSECRHFSGVCEELHGRRCALHLRIAHLLAGTFTRSTSWMEVVLEAELLPEDKNGLRPDVRAKRVSMGACAWADVSVASPFAARQLSRVTEEQLTPVAAIAREDKKVKK
ncbi:hypothetical protein I4F81_009837 [Pyropia yezoensis]|uniref:Uncharacterized protein n=1 Tax=Pyropia yezoensis TaxID=2788 RepID=A0ACC3CAS4_PYRYE|nr:hypothetical protein I4F81_009837 [Neopyropia yezoensis]